MSEPLLFTVCSDPAGLAATCTGGVLLVQVSIGWTCDHRAEIAESWTDGTEWVRARRVGLVRQARRLRVPHLRLLAHGKHRRAVSS
jgi:hypothetical protein